MHMNSYISDPCLVYKKMATDGGGGEETSMIASAISLVQIPTRILFLFANFHVTDILAIST